MKFRKLTVPEATLPGYTATRMGSAVLETYERGYADGSILYEDSGHTEYD